MSYTGTVKSINFTDQRCPEAVKIIDTIAKDEDRSGVQVTERLVIEAGKARAEAINHSSDNADDIDGGGDHVSQREESAA